MNQFRKNTEEQPAPKKQEASPFRGLGKVPELFGVISKEQVIGWMPYVFFITLLLIVYISNSYYAEKNIREIDKITGELKELRSEYITSKSELMFGSKQSEVARRLEGAGVKESTVPPRKIIVQPETE
jgi:hypothetical protein